MSRFYGTSGLSRSSPEYPTSPSKTLEGQHNRGAVVVRPHSGWTLCRHWIHIAAVAVTVGLAAINILNIYLMDADTADSGTILNAFQFAAKLHEVLVVAFLMLAMMDTVRSRLMTSRGVPFGYLLAPVLFNDLDWLMSHHFWSSVKPTWSSLPLTVLVLTAVPFANLAGPLSAITVLPRLGWSTPQAAAVFPTFWNASSGAMWPDTLAARNLAPVCTTSAGSQAGCPAGAFKYVWMTYDPAFQGATDCTTSGLRVACNTTLRADGFRQLSLEYDLDSLTTYASTPTDIVYETIAVRFVGGMALSLNLSDTKVIDCSEGRAD